MTLAHLLSESQIVAALASSERWEAISELVDCLVHAGKIAPTDRDDVIQSIQEREKTMSTGIGSGIAIPHASSDKVHEVIAAFGRSEKGVAFESLDNQPAFLIVLFIVPKDQFQAHLRTLAAIAKFLNDQAIRKELDAAADPAAILRVFENRSTY